MINKRFFWELFDIYWKFKRWLHDNKTLQTECAPSEYRVMSLFVSCGSETCFCPVIKKLKPFK